MPLFSFLSAVIAKGRRSFMTPFYPPYLKGEIEGEIAALPPVKPWRAGRSQ
jgi:hypothetical protein